MNKVRYLNAVRLFGKDYVWVVQDGRLTLVTDPSGVRNGSVTVPRNSWLRP